MSQGLRDVAPTAAAASRPHVPLRLLCSGLGQSVGYGCYGKMCMKFFWPVQHNTGFSRSRTRLPMQVRGNTCWFNPWVRKIAQSRAWQPTPVLLPGESHGQSRLAGCSPQGLTELDTTAALSRAWQHNTTPELSPVYTTQLHLLCLSLHYSVFLGCLMPSFSFSSVCVCL